MSAFLEVLSKLILSLIENNLSTAELFSRFKSVIPTQYHGNTLKLEVYFRLLVENYKKFKCDKMGERSQEYRDAVESCFSLAQTDHVWETLKTAPKVAASDMPCKVRQGGIIKSKLV